MLLERTKTVLMFDLTKLAGLLLSQIHVNANPAIKPFSCAHKVYNVIVFIERRRCNIFSALNNVHESRFHFCLYRYVPFIWTVHYNILL